MEHDAIAEAERAAWAAKTDAHLHTPAGFTRYKSEQGLSLLGVMGYAGSWRRSGLKGPALREFIADARLVLRRELEAAACEHGERLVMVSGATSIGVLELAYGLAAELGITAMGVTSKRARRYRLGSMAYLVCVGSRFGDESDDFVALCDGFVVLGGGDQSRYEAELGLSQGKPVTVISGFGGAADQLAASEPRPGLRHVCGR